MDFNLFKRDKAKEILMVTIGVVLTAFGFSFFFLPIKLVTGGTTGLGIALQDIFNKLHWQINVATIILILNIILLFVGLFFLGKDFFLKTAYGSLALPIMIELFEELWKYLEESQFVVALSGENALVSVFFGALISGIGIGLALKYNGSTGGTEVVQHILLDKLHIPFSVSLLVIDGFVLAIGYLTFRNFPAILHAVICIIISGAVVDSVVFSGFTNRAVYITTARPEAIRERIIKELDRGVTELVGRGGYSGKTRVTLMCILANKEYYRLKKIIDQEDPHAFYYALRASEVEGGGFTYGK